MEGGWELLFGSTSYSPPWLHLLQSTAHAPGIQNSNTMGLQA